MMLCRDLVLVDVDFHKQDAHATMRGVDCMNTVCLDAKMKMKRGHLSQNRLDPQGVRALSAHATHVPCLYRRSQTK